MLKEIFLSLSQGLDLPTLAQSIVTQGVVPAQYRGALTQIAKVLKAPGLGSLAWGELAAQVTDRGYESKGVLAVKSAAAMLDVSIPPSEQLSDLRDTAVAILENLLARDPPPELQAVVCCPFCGRHHTIHS